MTKRMLIDATHAEETRVVVLDGTRLEDFDVETSTKKQLKGNIYLAKVVRVEPSLQAAFVEYGGNRHGFLAFGEIHPDYYQIPVADRQRILAMQAEEARREEEEEERATSGDAETEPAVLEDIELFAPDTEGPVPDALAGPEAALDEPNAVEGRASSGWANGAEADPDAAAEPEPLAGIEAEHSSSGIENATESVAAPAAEAERESGCEAEQPVPAAELVPESAAPQPGTADHPQAQPLAIEYPTRHAPHDPEAAEPALVAESDDPFPAESLGEAPAIAREADADVVGNGEEPHAEPAADLPPPETVGGDADTVEETRTRRPPPRFLRNYKIQEVIRRRQILLVQVVKEERGTKGAALTTYLSLAGRYCVLMPNSPRGGGISRKITSAADRRRLKEITSEMDLPPGMGMIVRTAGANRPKPEIKRDCEYLMRLWDEIREHTMRSVAPALIYEEASLIKRAIRDVYSRDVDELVVDGEDGWKAARDFMRTLMPTHAKKVQLWEDGGMPLFAHHGVEAQLDSMMMPTVQLRSGGYLVINQTEALVAIDVNSGRSTRERNIEETALRTNLEASDEIARQLRLRDLAGLIVIDYIDMESRKHNGMVEKRLKDALKHDRARIQVGHISHFGLLEMSRQRLRPSLAETSFVMCAHCGGTGHVRSIESAALHVLRHIEEEGARRRAAEIAVHVAGPVAMYILNHKRELLRGIEGRYAMHVAFQADSTLVAPQMRLERLRAQTVTEAPALPSGTALPQPVPEPEVRGSADEVADDEAAAAVPGQEGADAMPGEEDGGEEQRRRKRRRRRRGRREDALPEAVPGLAAAPGDGEAAATGTEADTSEEDGETTAEQADGVSADGEDFNARNRRRGRRGGRRRRRGGESEISPVAELGAEQPDVTGAPYQGPTPANPFATPAYDIFDVIEQAGRAAPESLPQSEPTAAAPEPGLAAGLLPGFGPVVAPEPPPIPSAPEAERGRGLAEAAEQTATPIEAGESANAQMNAAGPREEPVVSAPPEPDTVAPAPPEPVTSAPPMQPILVGAFDAPAAPKKRGWWRR